MSFHYTSSIYENYPILQTCKAKLQHLQKVKLCLLLLKPHSIEIHRIKKSGELVFLQEKRFFANLKAIKIKTLEILEKNEPDLVFLLTADLQFVFFAIIEKEFQIYHKAEIYDAAKYEFNKILSQIDLRLDSVKGYIGILLTYRGLKELKIMDYEFNLAKDLKVSKIRDLLIEENEFVVDLYEMNSGKAQFVVGVLYDKPRTEYKYWVHEGFFWYDSERLILNKDPLKFKDDCLEVFYQPFSHDLYMIFSNKVSVWQNNAMKAEFPYKIRKGAFLELNDSTLIIDKITGDAYLIDPEKAKVEALGTISLCTSLKTLKGNRIFGGSDRDDSVIFEINEENELILHERIHKLGHIKQIVPIKSNGSRSFLINSANKRDSLNLIQWGVGINEEFILNFKENAMNMHLLRNESLIILTFSAKNLVLTVNNEEIKLFDAKTQAFKDVLEFEITGTYEYLDVFAIVTKNFGVFIFNSIEQNLLIHHKNEGITYFISHIENHLFWLSFITNEKYCIYHLDLKKPNELICFSLKSQKPVSSICALNSQNLLISYWFDMEIKIMIFPSISEDCPTILTLPQNPEFPCSVSINSMVFGCNDHLFIGLNLGKLLIYEIQNQNGTLLFHEIKTMDLGDQPIYLKKQLDNTILALSNKVILLRFEAENLQRIPVITSDLIGLEIFHDDKTILLKSNMIILGSFKKWGKFTITPLFSGNFTEGVIVSSGENDFMLARYGKSPEILNISQENMEINYSFDKFDFDEVIKDMAYDDKNQLLVVLTYNESDWAKCKAFLIKKRKKGTGNEKKMVFVSELKFKKMKMREVKKFGNEKFIVLEHNQLTIIGFNRKKNDLQILLSKKTFFTLSEMEIRGNLIICFDIFSKVYVFSYEEEKINLVIVNSGSFNGFLKNGGLLYDDLIYLNDALENDCLIIKPISGKTNGLDILQIWKMKENVSCFLKLEEKTGDSFEKLREKSVVWGTNYGNLEILVNVEQKIYEILRKIEGFLKISNAKNKEEEIFPYEKWKKVKQNVRFYFKNWKFKSLI